MDTASLDTWLGQLYGANVLGRGLPVEIENACVANLKSDPALMREATKRLTAITDDVTKRCFISKCHRSYLATVIMKAQQNG